MTHSAVGSSGESIHLATIVGPDRHFWEVNLELEAPADARLRGRFAFVGSVTEATYRTGWIFMEANRHEMIERAHGMGDVSMRQLLNSLAQ